MLAIPIYFYVLMFLLIVNVLTTITALFQSRGFLIPELIDSTKRDGLKVWELIFVLLVPLPFIVLNAVMYLIWPFLKYAGNASWGLLHFDIIKSAKLMRMEAKRK